MIISSDIRWLDTRMVFGNNSICVPAMKRSRCGGQKVESHRVNPNLKIHWGGQNFSALQLHRLKWRKKVPSNQKRGKSQGEPSYGSEAQRSKTFLNVKSTRFREWWLLKRVMAKIEEQQVRNWRRRAEGTSVHFTLNCTLSTLLVFCSSKFWQHFWKTGRVLLRRDAKSCHKII